MGIVKLGLFIALIFCLGLLFPTPINKVDELAPINKVDELEKRIYGLEKEVALQKLTIEKNEEARRLRQVVDELHFDQLNHEADRVKQVQDSYFLKSDATSSEKALRVALVEEQSRREEKEREMDKTIKELNDFKNNVFGQQAVMTIVVSFIVVGIGLVGNYFATRRKYISGRKAN